MYICLYIYICIHLYIHDSVAAAHVGAAVSKYAAAAANSQISNVSSLLNPVLELTVRLYS